MILGIRSAESSRAASCKFADTVASISINKYRSIISTQSQDPFKQTVLAAFLVQYDENTVPEVVAIGVGTKYVKRNLKHKVNPKCKNLCIHNDDSRVRDSHAEVLARRGLKKYLLEQLIWAIKVSKSDKQHKCIFKLKDEEDDKYSSCSSSTKYFASRFYLRPHVTIHLYTSSVPCGNSSIKKWAKCKAAPIYQGLGEFEFPNPLAHPHPRLFVTAREQGEVAPLYKRDPSARIITAQPSHTSISRANLERTHGRSAIYEVPVGTASISSGEGCTLSCSDKIAIWNALGLQGALLSELLCEPLYLSSCTVGRKFSARHCERALCCRLQDFGYDGNRLSFRTCHPVMLGTAVKLDESAIVTSVEGDWEGGRVGASFSDPRCIVWSAAASFVEGDLRGGGVEGGGLCEVIDGTTGRLLTPDLSGENGGWEGGGETGSGLGLQQQALPTEPSFQPATSPPGPPKPEKGDPRHVQWLSGDLSSFVSDEGSSNKALAGEGVAGHSSEALLVEFLRLLRQLRGETDGGFDHSETANDGFVSEDPPTPPPLSLQAESYGREVTPTQEVREQAVRSGAPTVASVKERLRGRGGCGDYLSAKDLLVTHPRYFGIQRERRFTCRGSCCASCVCSDVSDDPAFKT